MPFSWRNRTTADNHLDDGPHEGTLLVRVEDIAYERICSEPGCPHPLTANRTACVGHPAHSQPAGSNGRYVVPVLVTTADPGAAPMLACVKDDVVLSVLRGGADLPAPLHAIEVDDLTAALQAAPTAPAAYRFETVRCGRTTIITHLSLIWLRTK
ncbi:hypothetical protein GPECTOR_53g155 [Gonium pectorale]|uniref:Uncharacterized protein n=1 Tax=Gonium pectorale TaxID=33097 RepID=A0A150G6T0_GONPE|nr:hypothetical protein GPECTOR_53g155 [Gonium pectorale]|eukprot:KXZ45569.1 hypothetical protein GPECTOR_53g155 [Gonium pectorale]